MDKIKFYIFDHFDIRNNSDITDILNILKNEKTDYKIIFSNCHFYLEEEINFNYSYIKEVEFTNSMFYLIDDDKKDYIQNLVFSAHTNLLISTTGGSSICKKVLHLKISGINKSNIFLSGVLFRYIHIENSQIDTFVCENYNYHGQSSCLILENVRIKHLNLINETFTYIDITNTHVENILILNADFPLIENFDKSNIKEISIFGGGNQININNTNIDANDYMLHDICQNIKSVMYNNCLT